MNIHKLIAFTLLIAASSAHAVLDIMNLPETVPTELQDKLAWGICKRDKQVVIEALDQGANSYEIEIMYPDHENQSVNAYELAMDEPYKHPRFKTINDKLRDGGETLTTGDMTDILHIHRMIFDMWELLIEKRVSVDKAEYDLFSGKEPVRLFIQKLGADRAEQRKHHKNAWEREFYELLMMRIDRFEEFIWKYQPAQK